MRSIVTGMTTLGIAWAVCVGGTPGDEAAEADKPVSAASGDDVGFRFVDEFGGELKPEWKPLRPDPTHYSLSDHPGKLTITTEYGSIHRDAATRGMPLAKNMFMIDNPAADECGLVVTTCLDSFRPKEPWQQAGLILYDDDDNYLKWVCQSSSSRKPEWNLLRENDAVSTITKYPVEGDLPQKMWLRVTTRGNHHEYAVSSDGKTFEVKGELPWGSGPVKQIGLVAKNGTRRDTPELASQFDSFEVRSLTPSEKAQPAFVERQKLAGLWKVASCKLRGEDLAEAPLSEFSFTDARLTMTEGDKQLEGEYSLDLTIEPRQLLATSFANQQGRSLAFSYELKGDMLTLCCDLRPGSAAPPELKTAAGDSRLLVVLKRAGAKP